MVSFGYFEQTIIGRDHYLPQLRGLNFMPSEAGDKKVLTILHKGGRVEDFLEGGYMPNGWSNFGWGFRVFRDSNYASYFTTLV